MSNRLFKVLRVVSIVAIAPVLLIAYAGCHSQGGGGPVPAGNFEFGGGVNAGGTPSEGTGTQGVTPGSTPGAAGVPTVNLKLVKLDGTEMDVLDFPFSPLVISIKAAFSEAMNKAEVEKATSLIDSKSNKVDGDIAWSADKLTMTFKPKSRLAARTKYSLQISNEALSEAGGAIEPVDKSFTTMTPGDVNGDGVPDFVVGATDANNQQGAAYVISGDAPNGKDIAVILGVTPKTKLGRTVAIVGDLNADGYADVAVGAPVETVNSKGGVGAVYVFSGKKLITGNTDASKADASVVGQGLTTYELFGSAVAGAGDINGDGFDDLIVGAPGFANNTGKTYLFSGENLLAGNSNKVGADTIAKTMISGAAKDQFGESLASAGDIDGDKVLDIIIGEPGMQNVATGKAYLFSGSVLMKGNLQTSDALIAITGEANSNFGSAVAGIGDYDGVGIDYVAVGAPFNQIAGKTRGSVYVFKGGPAFKNTMLADGTKFDGQIDDQHFGYSVAGVGDFGGDGKTDLLIGAPDGNNGTGNIYVYMGGGGPPQANGGSAVKELFGFSVSGIGDVNSDGKVDYLVGSPGANAVYLYGGAAPVKYTGMVQTDKFGISVSGAGSMK